MALESIPDPPPTLYGIGDPSILAPGLAIVGARRATPYGLRCASIFSSWAARAGLPVISGAALGCDQAAHRGALEAGGETVAVLGCGADVDYPVRSSALLDRIRAHGVVVSELPWGTQPRALDLLPAKPHHRGTGSRRVWSSRPRCPAARSLPRTVPSRQAVTCTPSRARYSRRSAEEPTASYDRAHHRSPVLTISRWSSTSRPLPTRHPQSPQRTLCCALRWPIPARPDDLAHLLGMSIVEVARSLSRHERLGVLAKYSDGRYGPG